MTTISLIGRPVLNKPDAGKRSADARWLITFADLAAVMVAFFVLLFSMAEVDSDKWEGATTAFDRQFRISEATVTPRPVESSNITQRVEEPALDLRYLELLIGQQLKEHEVLQDVRMAVSADRLALDFPGELVFASGRTGVSTAGRETLFVLGGMFAGIDNRVAVIGHTAANQTAGQTADGQEDIDWELALVRAARVARSLRRAGYDRPIELQGRSGSRFGGPAPLTADESSVNSSSGRRAMPVRRIEIIVQTESGDGP